MARCLTKESYGRRVFYGSMIAEGIIAMIWAAAAMAFFNGTTGLQEAFGSLGGAGGVVNKISIELLGPIGGVLAMLGVIVCPITSGDTAFRSARLTIADAMKYDQGPIKKRLTLALPLFVVGFGLTRIDFNIVWRYFAWSTNISHDSTLGRAAYLVKHGKNTAATFMTAVSITYRPSAADLDYQLLLLIHINCSNRA